MRIKSLDVLRARYVAIHTSNDPRSLWQYIEQLLKELYGSITLAKMGIKFMDAYEDKNFIVVRVWHKYLYHLRLAIAMTNSAHTELVSGSFRNLKKRLRIQYSQF